MKKTLIEASEEIEHSCCGCTFFIQEDVCATSFCQRLLVKDKDCKGKIYLLQEPQQKPKKKRTKKS